MTTRQKTAARKDDAANEPVTIPAIDVDAAFAAMVQSEMDEAGAEITRLNSQKIAREEYYASAIDRIIEARDAELFSLDGQISRQERKRAGCTAAIEAMHMTAVFPSQANVVSLKSIEAERNVA